MIRVIAHIENEQLQSGVALHSRSPFLMIARIYRSCLEHYDNYLCVAQKVGKVEISLRCDCMMEDGVCAELRATLRSFLGQQKEMPEEDGKNLWFVSSVPF